MTSWIIFNRNLTKSLKPLSVSLLIFSLAGCAQKPGPETKLERAPLTVKSLSAQIRPMERVIGVSGSFHAHEQATLSVKIPGRLQSISVDIGSKVKAGELLAQIDSADYEIRLKQAEAALAQARARLGLPLQGDTDEIEPEKTAAVLQAKAQLEEATQNRNRIRDLAGEKIAAQSELEIAEAAFLVATSRYQNALEEIRERQALTAQRRAELEFARKQLADTRIKAPFDGVVQQRRAGIGEFLETGTPLLLLAKIDPLRLRLEIPERSSLGVRPGQLLHVFVGDDTNGITAKISRVSPMLSETNRMLTAESDIPATPSLRPGLFARATIVVSENDPALCVPEEAVTSFVGLEKVFVIEEGKTREKSIATGRRSNGWVEVVSGIAEGDRVILNPGNIRSGQPVTEEDNAEAR